MEWIKNGGMAVSERLVIRPKTQLSDNGLISYHVNPLSELLLSGLQNLSLILFLWLLYS